MPTSNLDHWNRFADIDPSFTKEIKGKAYKGTSPNPQYVIRCLTELFGPVGQGFGWTVVAEDFTPLGDEVIHWCRIQFWHTDRANVFDSYGQTKALMKTKSGMMSDEDAPKKSLTDAIVKAASHVGIAANIFLGRWDDNKHIAEVRQRYADEEAEQRKAAEPPFEHRARTDEILGWIDGCKTQQHLRDVWVKNGATLKRVEADKPPMFAELVAAKDRAKARLTDDPAHQAPPHEAADQHEYQ